MSECNIKIHESSGAEFNNEDYAIYVKNNGLDRLKGLTNTQLTQAIKYADYQIGVIIRDLRKQGKDITIKFFQNKKTNSAAYYSLKLKLKQELELIENQSFKKNLEYILDNFNEFKEIHSSKSVLNIDYDEELDIYKDKDENEFSKFDEKRGDDKSIWDVANNDIKQLFSLLPKSKVVSDVNNIIKIEEDLNSEGMPFLINPIAFVNRVILEFEGLNSYDFWNKLNSNEILRKYPEIKFLLDTLPSLSKTNELGQSVPHTLNEINLLVGLENYLTKPKIDIYVGEADGDKKSYKSTKKTYNNFVKVRDRFRNSVKLLSKEAYQVKKGYVEIKDDGRRMYKSVPIIKGIDKNFNKLNEILKALNWDISKNVLASDKNINIVFSLLNKDFYKSFVNILESKQYESIFDYIDSLDSKELKRQYTSEIEELINFLAKYDEATPTLSTKTAEGEPIYAISQNNSMTIITNKINNSNTLNKLYEEAPYFKDSAYFQSTDLISKLFDENGNKYNFAKLELSNYAGLEITNSVGISTRRLNERDKAILDFNNISKYGFADISRTESSATYYFMRYIGEKGFSTIFEDNMWQTAYNSTKLKLQSKAYNKFFKYLNAEISNIQNSINPDFYLFSFLSEELKADLRVEKDFLNNFPIKERVNQELQVYLYSSYNEYKKRLINYDLIFEKDGKLALKEDRILQIPDNTTVESVIYANVINNMINNIESAIIYAGDFSQIKDFNKRYKAFLSTGEKANTSIVLNNYINNEFNKFSLEQIVTGKKPSILNRNEFKSYVLKEDTNGNDKKTYKSLKSIFNDNTDLSAYENYKIGDGQGYITLDAYKEFMLRVNNWDEFKEAAYVYESLSYLKKKSYSNKPFPANLSNALSRATKVVFENPTKATLPIIKLQYSGRGKNINDKSVIDKFSVFPLIPSALNAKTEALMKEMFEKGVSYTKYESATKGYKPSNLDDVIELYTENLKEQLKTNSNIKELVTWGSQFRKLLFTTLFKDGKAINEKANNLFNKYKELLKGIANEQKGHLLDTLGIELVDSEDVSFKSVNKEKFISKVKEEIKRRGLDDSAINYNHLTNSTINLFEFTGVHNLVNDILFGLIDKGLRVYKINGNDYIQLSNSMYDKLAFYEYSEKKTRKAEVRVSLQGEYLKLLNKTHPDGERVETLERLNQALKDKDWYNKNEKSFTITGYRIPTQGPNSMEILNIKEFLPSTTGNVVQLYDEIVAKSGSDFDIDKLRMFTPTFSESGEYVDENIEETINSQIKELEDLYPMFRNLSNEELFGESEDGENDVVDATDVLFKKLFPDIKSSYTDVTTALLEDIQFKLKDLKRLKLEKTGILTNKFIELYEEVLTLPEIFKSLVTPNSSNLMEEATRSNFEKAFPTLKYNDYISYPKGLDIFDISKKSDTNKAMIQVKAMVGPFAVANTHHQLSLQNNLHINKIYNITSKGQDNIILGLLNDDEEKSITNENYIYLSSEYTTDGTSISDILSNGITAAVDAGGNKFLGISPVRKDNFAQFNFLLKTRTPLSRIFNYLSLRSIRELRGELDKGIKEDTALNNILKKYGVNKDNLSIIYNSLQENRITQEELNKTLSNPNENENILRKAIVYYYYLTKHAKNLKDFQQHFDYDTSKLQSGLNVESKIRGLNDISQLGFISVESLEKYKNDSIISNFINNSLLKQIGAEYLPIVNSKEFIYKALANKFIGYKLTGGSKISSKKTQRVLYSDYIQSIIQKYGEYNFKPLYEQLENSIKGEESFAALFNLYKDTYLADYEALALKYRWINNIILRPYRVNNTNLNAIEIARDYSSPVEELELLQESTNASINAEESFFSNKESFEAFKQLRDKFFLLGIAQGFNKSQFYFEDIVPNSFKLPIYKKAYENFKEAGIEKEYIKEFFNNFQFFNKDIFPKQENALDLQYTRRFKPYAAYLLNDTASDTKTDTVNNNLQTQATDVKDDLQSNPINSMDEITNHSGGAYGGDTFWDIIGREFGVINHKHYRDSENTSLSKQLKDKGVKAEVLSKEQMDKARKDIKSLLGIEYKNDLQGNLQVRNYYQVANSDAVFAIAKLDTNDNFDSNAVLGGTNTAVQLAIKLNKPVYVWDIFTEQWYKFNGNVFKKSETPILTKDFAGIGSRDIEDYNVLDKETNKWTSRKEYVGKEKEEKAKQAIRDVYQNTLNNLQNTNNVIVNDNKEIKGINIRSDKNNPNSLANRLTNPNWYAKDLFDVETNYKANASKIKAPELNAEDALKYDMNLMYKLQVQKFQKNPELIDEINAQGGLQFIQNSSHIVGVKNSRWEGKGLESNFIKVLAQSYTTVAKELNKFVDSDKEIESRELPDNNSREYTPENIESLKPNEIFVFGSNSKGIHGKGAALIAKQKFGAKEGQAEGLQGQSYAIITKKDWKVPKSSSLNEIGEGLADFFEYANNNPEKKFYVTKLGSSLAGYTTKEIKNEIKSVNDVNGGNFIPGNVILPKEYEVRDNKIGDVEKNSIVNKDTDLKSQLLDNALNIAIKEYLPELYYYYLDLPIDLSEKEQEDISYLLFDDGKSKEAKEAEKKYIKRILTKEDLEKAKIAENNYNWSIFNDESDSSINSLLKELENRATTLIDDNVELEGLGFEDLLNNFIRHKFNDNFKQLAEDKLKELGLYKLVNYNPNQLSLFDEKMLNIISKEQLINIINKNKDNIKGLYKTLFELEDGIEAASTIYDQLISSESEAKTARDIVGDELVNAILNYFSNIDYTKDNLDNNITQNDTECP